ncbi:unnamed protein product [Diplocarpon coronariae]
MFECVHKLVESDDFQIRRSLQLSYLRMRIGELEESGPID